MLLAISVPALGQPAPGDSSVPKWDAAAGFGLLLSGESRASTPPGDLVVDLGRYVTRHAKASVQVSNAGRTDHLYESDYRYSASSSVTTTYTARETLTNPRPVVAAAALTYQWFENVFVHPFVSGGVRLAWLSDTVTTSTLLNAPPYLLTSSTSTSRTRLDARPTAAVGAKAYFANGRMFMRPEVMLVVDREGTPRGMIRVLVGSDF